MTNPQAELRRQLMNALYHDDLSQVTNLLNQGVNVNLPYNHNGLTPLMNAVHHPQAMMRKDVIYGLAHNSDTAIKNNEGKTAYDIAKENEAFDDMINLRNILTF